MKTHAAPHHLPRTPSPFSICMNIHQHPAAFLSPKSTASRLHVAHLSSASADLPFYRTFAVLLRQNCFFIACFPAGLGSATAHVRRLPRKGRAGRAFESSSKHRAHGKAVPAMHLSSPSANLQLKNAKKARKYAISGLFLYPKFCLDCSALMEFERKFMGLQWSNYWWTSPF